MLSMNVPSTMSGPITTSSWTFQGSTMRTWPTGFTRHNNILSSNISPDQQVQLASFHLEDIALQWHRWLTKFRGPLTWKEFSKAVHLCFGPTDYEDLSEALTRLKQTSSVAAYQEAFERLSHLVDGLPKNFLIGCIVAGLLDDIRLDVKIKQPRTLSDTIGVARLIEERNQLQRNRPKQLAPNPLWSRKDQDLTQRLVC